MKSRLFVTLVSSFALYATDNVFVGKWRLAPDKSMLTGNTVVYQNLPSGEWTATYAGRTDTFRMDGKEHPDVFGRRLIWVEKDERTWEVITKNTNGKTLWTQQIVVSPDQKSMTMTITGTTPTGEPFRDVVVFNREAGNEGLAGTWRSQKMEAVSETLIEVKGTADGLNLALPAYKFSVELPFDGREVKGTGETLPPGTSFVAKRVSDRKLELIQKHNGSVLATMELAVSPDGRTLTNTARQPGADQPVVEVYEREE